MKDKPLSNMVGDLRLNFSVLPIVADHAFWRLQGSLESVLYYQVFDGIIMDIRLSDEDNY